jgi:hypothetical protein
MGRRRAAAPMDGRHSRSMPLICVSGRKHMTRNQQLFVEKIELGTGVVIDHEPLRGVPGTLMWTDDIDSVTVLVHLLDGPVLVQLPASDVSLGYTGGSEPRAH